MQDFQDHQPYVCFLSDKENRVCAIDIFGVLATMSLSIRFFSLVSNSCINIVGRNDSRLPAGKGCFLFLRYSCECLLAYHTMRIWSCVNENKYAETQTQTQTLTKRERERERERERARERERERELERARKRESERARARERERERERVGESEKERERDGQKDTDSDTESCRETPPCRNNSQG